MLRPGRIIGFAILGILIYAGFFAVPDGNRAPDAFDPVVVATSETDAWRGVLTKQDMSVYTSYTVMLREQYRYPWYKAVQAGYYLGRASIAFNVAQGKYERVLPDLEAAADVQKEWTGAAYDSAAVARAQLDWWIALRNTHLFTSEQVVSFMANEYVLRYGTNSSRISDAVFRRTQAAQIRDLNKVDPDWPGIQKLLTESYQALADAIRTRRPNRTPA